MASLSSRLQPSIPARKLAELLEEQQEPFLLDVYLLQNGYASPRASSACWPRGNSACRRSLRRSSSLRSSTWTRPSGLLRSALKLFDGMSSWKRFKSEDHKASRSMECEEMQDLGDDGLKLTLDYELQTKALCIFKELLQLAYSTTPASNELDKSKFNLDHQPEKLVLESERNEAENNLDPLDDHVLRDRDSYRINEMKIPQVSGLISWRDWKDYKPEVRMIGLQIEAEIFEDMIREETVMEMIDCIQRGVYIYAIYT